MKGDIVKKRNVSMIYNSMIREQKSSLQEKIVNECEDFLSQPNQCAWTDRCVENIVEFCSNYKSADNNVQDVLDRCVNKLKTL